MITAEEQILAKALAAYNARITDVDASVGTGYGTPTASLELTDDPEGASKLVFTFDNIRGNGITSVEFVESGPNEGKVTFTLLDGTSQTFDGIASAIAYLKSVCWVSTFADPNNDGHVVVTVAAS